MYGPDRVTHLVASESVQSSQDSLTWPFFFLLAEVATVSTLSSKTKLKLKNKPTKENGYVLSLFRRGLLTISTIPNAKEIISEHNYTQSNKKK